VSGRSGARALALVGAAALALGSARVAAADDEGPPPLRLIVENVVVGRVNPLALADLLRAGLAARLYQRPQPVLRDNFFFFGVAPRITASSLRMGPQLELQPLSILSLRLSAELVRFWGIFDSVQSFTSPVADWSDSAVSRNGKAGLNYPTEGAHVIFEPTFQVRFGPIAVRDHLTLDYWNLRLRPGDRVFYEAGADTLIPNGGLVVTNDVDVAWLSRVHLAVAVRYTLTVPLYRATDWAPGELPDGALNRQQRLGLALAYTFFDRHYTRFHSLTLFAVAAWYLEHRYRTGADVSQALPYLLGGVSFQSDWLLAR
jgi:hypothetical protein